MDLDPEDQEIIRLLTKIKEAEGGYPEHMLAARRGNYQKRMVEIGLGIPADMGIKDAAKDVKPSHISPATSTLVETALVVAILVEAGTAAYFYRDELADFFRQTATRPRVQEVVSPPAVSTSFDIQAVAPSPASTATVPSATIWSPPAPTGISATPTGTPIPGVADHNSTSAAAATGEVNLLNGTAGPSDSSGNNGNNGNHYGQTPKPERTKESGNNPPPKEENDKPPKENEDKFPKDNNDKPPKDNDNKPPQK